MPTVIPCPECGKRLKIRDESMLGKKVQCPGCGHRFVLERPAPEPAEELVEFQLAGAEVTGQAGRYVPDGPAATATAPGATTVAAPPPGVDPNAPAPAAFESSVGGVARLKEIRRKNTKRRNVGIAIGVVTALAVGGSWWAIQDYKAQRAAEKERERLAAEEAKKPTVDKAYKESKEALRANLEMAKQFDPTSDKPADPIKLLYVPDGTSIVFHLRPAELWQEGTIGQEVLFGLGPLGEWAVARLKEYGLTEPANIEEALFCIVLGARGSEPRVSTVITYREAIPKSDLIANLFEDRVRDVPEIWVGGGRAYMLQNAGRTLASCPDDLSLIDEMAAATGQSANAMGFVQDLLNRSHRDHHFTMVFRPDDLVVHEEVLFDELLRPAALQIASWFGEDVDAVRWSVHLGEKTFYSELGMCPRSTSATNQVISEERLQVAFRNRLDALPMLLYDVISKYMEPRTVGERKLIGRFPAMMKAYAVCTLGGTDDGYVQLTTVVKDDRAAPNLAVAGLLTWAESTRTDFTKSVDPSTGPRGGDLPVLMADRLKKVIEIDFRRTPLQEAYSYIADETKVPFEIDGDALKLAGYTKNMAQNQKLGNVPATKALATILSQYDKMCIVVDEKAKKAIVMTYDVAKKKGLKPFEFE